MHGQLLRLDHDPYCPPLTMRELLKRARRANVRIVELIERRSPSGRGCHRIVKIRPAPRSAMQVVALQLLFGSDPYREAYLYNRARLVDARRVGRYWRKSDSWNVLYIHPGKSGRSSAGR